MRGKSVRGSVDDEMLHDISYVHVKYLLCKSFQGTSEARARDNSVFFSVPVKIIGCRLGVFCPLARHTIGHGFRG